MKRPRSRSSSRVPKGKRTLGAMVRSIRVTGDTVYHFKRQCELNAWYFNALGIDTRYASNEIDSFNNYYGYFKFALADLNGFTDFTNLFEAFRIKAVTLKFVPVKGTGHDVTPQVTSANVEYSSRLQPLVVAAENAPILTNFTFAQILEDQGSVILLSDKVHTMHIRNPKLYQPADGLTVAGLAAPWLDTATGGGAAAHHYGAKFRFQATSPSVPSSVAYRVFATYHIECKGAQ